MHALDRIRSELVDAIKSAKMESAGFDAMGGSTITRKASNGKVIEEGQAETSYIKERTRLYRDSWIVGPLERALACLDANAAVFKEIQALEKALRGSGVTDCLRGVEEALKANRNIEWS